MNKLLQFLLVGLFAFPILLNAQLDGKIELLNDQKTYQVSIIPGNNWAPPMSITNSAQMTLKVPTGGFSLVNFQSVTGIWNLNTPIIAPPEASEYDYFFFKIRIYRWNETAHAACIWSFISV